MSYQPDNRAKKIAGRKKRQRFLQGNRSYLHAMVNSIAKRAQNKKRKR